MVQRGSSKRWISIALLLGAVAPNVGLRAQTVIDRVVAIVGNEIILESELGASVQFYVLNNRVDPNTPDLKERVLDAMVNEKLMLAKAIEDSIVVSEEEVTQQLDNRIQQWIQQSGSEQRLVEFYGMPINRIKLEFRDDMRNQLMVSKLYDTKFRSMATSRREVEKFFATYQDSLPRVPDQVELRHIFVVPKVDEKTRGRTYAKARAIVDSIRAGGDFADFARRYSQDAGSAQQGGDLGFARRGLFVKEFEEAAFTLREGEMSDVVESGFGLHIIQLLERRGESVHPRHILIKIERDEESDQEAIDFLRTLRDSVLNRQASFPDLAKRHSEDEETKNFGGSLSLVPLDQLDTNIIAAVRDLKENEISDPTRVPYGDTHGYHIFLLEKRLPEHAMNLTDDWKMVEQFATTHKRNAEYARWLEELHRSIYWNVRL